MAKTGGGRLQKPDIEAIAHKLGGEKSTGKHIKVAIKYDGVLVADFGIRHGRKEAHGHVPKALYLSEVQTIQLARCQISKAEYFEILRRKGMLPSAVEGANDSIR